MAIQLLVAIFRETQTMTKSFKKYFKLTKPKILFSVLLIVLVGKCFGQSTVKCILYYKSFTDSSETNLYLDTVIKFDYKTQYNHITKANINKEVENAILHSDFRFIAISGYSYLYPGLEGGYKELKNETKGFIGLSPKYEQYIRKYGFKIVEGTSDAINVDDPPLQRVAYDFAKKYNQKLLRKLK